MIGKKYSTGAIPYVEFKEGNNINFGQDFSFWNELPSDVRFYPKNEINNSICFVGDRYGITQKENKYGLSGEYGNGCVYVSVKDLPTDLVLFCRNNLLEKNEK
jgi:hypothetical protein